MQERWTIKLKEQKLWRVKLKSPKKSWSSYSELESWFWAEPVLKFLTVLVGVLGILAIFAICFS